MGKTPASQKPPDLSPVINVSSGEPTDELETGSQVRLPGPSEPDGLAPHLPLQAVNAQILGGKEQVAEREVKETI